MGLRSATADTYRIEAPTGADWTTDAFTVCGWVTMHFRNSTRDVVFANWESGVGGFALRFNGAAMEFVYGDNAAGNVTQTHAHANYTTGKRLFVFASIDAAGNGYIGHVFDGVVNSTTFVGNPPSNALSANAPQIAALQGAAAQKLRGTLENLILYRVSVPQVKIEAVDAVGGAYTPQPADRISHLRLNQGIPGTDTDSVVPIDIIKRTWSVGGAGVASVWEPSLAPRRRRS